MAVKDKNLYCEYERVEYAQICFLILLNRKYDGKSIDVVFYDPLSFADDILAWFMLYFNHHITQNINQFDYRNSKKLYKSFISDRNHIIPNSLKNTTLDKAVKNSPRIAPIKVL